MVPGRTIILTTVTITDKVGTLIHTMDTDTDNTDTDNTETGNTDTDNTVM